MHSRERKVAVVGLAGLAMVFGSAVEPVLDRPSPGVGRWLMFIAGGIGAAYLLFRLLRDPGDVRH
jgi:hypothetical protein